MGQYGRVREGMGGYGTVWGDLGAFEGGTGWYGTGFPRKFLNRPVASTSLRGSTTNFKLIFLSLDRFCDKSFQRSKNQYILTHPISLIDRRGLVKIQKKIFGGVYYTVESTRGGVTLWGGLKGGLKESP